MTDMIASLAAPTTAAPVKLQLKFLDMTPNKYFHMLIRGPVKSGKTFLAGQVLGIPEFCPVFWFSLDYSHVTLTTTEYMNKFGITDLNAVARFAFVKDELVFKTALETLRQSKMPLVGNTPYRTIVVDNWSEFVNRLVAEESEEDKGNTARGRALEDTAGLGDYRIVKTKVTKLIHTLRYELGGVNIISTADERIDSFDIDGFKGAKRSRVETGVPPSLIATINRSHDINGALTMKGETRVIRFSNDAVVQGLGDRFMRLPAQMENPTLRQILTTTGHLKGTK